MRVNEIEKLLTRYYNGETTEAEEQELKRFFAEEEVPAHLWTEQQIFRQLDATTEPAVPAHLSRKLEGWIDQWETQERREQKLKRHTRRLHLQWIGSIAASVILLFSVGIYLHQQHAPLTPQDTCATPEEAYAQAQKALIKLSVSLNKGIDKMESMQETTEKIQENVNEQLNRINNIKP